MTTLTFTYPASTTAPLTCDCQGAPVFIKFKAEYAQLTREGVGVAHASLESRQQLSDGTWAYVFAVHEPDLVSPVPALSSGMVQTVCCQGCQGYSAEAFHTNEFGGRLILESGDLTAGRIHVRRTIRPFRLSDLRFWIDSPALAPITFQLWVNDVEVLSAPITISPGQYMSSGAPQFADEMALIIPESATIEIEILTTGSMATGYGNSDPAAGLEVWFFGHLDPSPYLLTTAGDSDVPAIGAVGPANELVIVDGATFLKTTFPNGQVFYTPGFTTAP